jgi:prevent-host-death family protein
LTDEYSIAEARHDLASIIHKLERQPAIRITRRGKPVAILLSMREYQRLSAVGDNFWKVYTEFREKFDLAELDIEPSIFEDLRDRQPGRQVDL